MEIEKKVGGSWIRQQTLGPFRVADTVFAICFFSVFCFRFIWVFRGALFSVWIAVWYAVFAWEKKIQ
jgi:hypothetical protein